MISTLRYSFHFGGKHIAARSKVVLPYVFGVLAKPSPSRNRLSYSAGVTNNKTNFLIVPGLLKTKPNLTISQAEGKPIVRYFVAPSETNLQLRELLRWANEHSSTMPILPFVTIFHYNFVRIAPFPEHNGRVARLLVTLFMLRRAYPPMIIEPDDKKLYTEALAHADLTGDLVPLTKLFGRSIINTYEELIRLQGPLVDGTN